MFNIYGILIWALQKSRKIKSISCAIPPEKKIPPSKISSLSTVRGILLPLNAIWKTLLFVEPWLINNKQQVCPTETWKYHFINSWTSCLMYAWFSQCLCHFPLFWHICWSIIWHSTIVEMVGVQYDAIH